MLIYFSTFLSAGQWKLKTTIIVVTLLKQITGILPH